MSKILSLASLLTAGLLLAGCAGFGGGAATPTPAPIVEEEPLQIVADAKVLPARSADLRFSSSGAIAAILVAEGDQVAEGAPLARLDTRELELAVAEARAGLAEATARYEQVSAGATPEEIAAAEAAVAQAQAGVRTASGSVTAQDLAAARAEVQRARETLARLEAGPKATEAQQAQAAVAQAQANLQSRRDALSAAKSRAEEAVTQAANLLRDAQDDYSRIYWDNRERERYLDGDALDQIFLDAEAAALRAVQNAEAALAQAQIDLENARQAEVSGVAAAEAQLREAQARLDQLLAGADRDQIAAARAALAFAQANLAALTGEARAGQVDAANAGVAQAQAKLDQVSAGPRSADLALAQAQIDKGAVALRKAELALDQGTLRAPFAGTIFAINLEIGELPPAEAPALVIADLSAWRLETSDLTELDVAAVRPGAPVAITFDAIPDLSLTGVVTRIKGLGESFQGDVIYTVLIEPAGWDERLRWNMTATVAIGV